MTPPSVYRQLENNTVEIRDDSFLWRAPRNHRRSPAYVVVHVVVAVIVVAVVVAIGMELGAAFSVGLVLKAGLITAGIVGLFVAWRRFFGRAMDVTECRITFRPFALVLRTRAGRVTTTTFDSMRAIRVEGRVFSRARQALEWVPKINSVADLVTGKEFCRITARTTTDAATTLADAGSGSSSHVKVTDAITFARLLGEKTGAPVVIDVEAYDASQDSP
jgi:hypothetical protein